MGLLWLDKERNMYKGGALLKYDAIPSNAKHLLLAGWMVETHESTTDGEKLGLRQTGVPIERIRCERATTVSEWNMSCNGTHGTTATDLEVAAGSCASCWRLNWRMKRCRTNMFRTRVSLIDKI